MNRRTVLLGCLVVVGACAAWLWLETGLYVEVVNAGTTPIHDVVVHTTGHSYDIGTIGPGKHASRRVTCDEESHVALTWRTPDGTSRRAAIDCYFEGGWPGYSGVVLGEIDSGAVVRSEVDIRLGW